jgi:DnaK suppressor protein
MKTTNLQSLREQLQRERRGLLAAGDSQSELQAISGDRIEEFEEQSQRERDAAALEPIAAMERDRIAAIDAALERMTAGNYGRCLRCGADISEERLRVDPAAELCVSCSQTTKAERKFAPADESELMPESGRLPPDLAMLDDEELQAHLADLVRQDERIDTQELEIVARNGVVYLEGALPSEPEHEVVLNILTDIAGVQDVVDHLEIQRLAWERTDRSAAQPATENPPRTYPDHEPYGGTEDITVTNEEGVNYDPPDNPPPPHRKD